MATPAQIVRKYLIDLGLFQAAESGGSPAWPAVTGFLPDQDDSPDRIAAVRDSGARDFGCDSREPASLAQPTVQVMVRAAAEDYDVGYAKTSAVEAALRRVGVAAPKGVGQPLIVVGSEVYLFRAAHVQTPATPLGQQMERHNRLLYSVNVQVVYDAL